MQKIIDIASGAFLIAITLSFMTTEKIFMNEAASCFTLLFAGIAGICRLSLQFFHKDSGMKLSITAIDLAFSLFLFWIVLNSFLVKKGEVDPFLWHKLCAVAGFYLTVRLTKQKEFLLYALVLSGVIQAIIATVQKCGLLFSHHTMFDVTGSFGNPGQLGGYLAVCLAVSLCLFMVNFKEKRRITSALLFAGSVLQGFGLYLSDSRAGWVGLFAGLVCGVFFLFPSILKKHRISTIASAVALFSVGIILLYSYRPKSADARLLIWRVSCDMIAGSPLLGHGAGAFNDKYMLYQAAFFEQHPESRFAVVADNAGYPFNELLNTAISLGIIGVALLLFLLWTAFFNKRVFQKNANDTIFQAGLSAWLAFALFSYPAGVFPLLLLAVTCLAGIESSVKRSFRLPRRLYGIIILLLTVVLLQVGRHTAELKRLSGAFRSMNLHGNMDEVESSYNRMKSNPTFNSYYMAWMENQPVERYTDRVKDASPSCEGFCMTGNYYLKTGDMEQAAQAFHTASKMVPTRMRPKYALWKLHVEKGDTAAAKEMAQTILNCPLKIESVYTLKVKKEVRTMLETERHEK
jgi:O-antigen ligase